MKKVIKYFLAILAKKIIKKYKPFVVAITGSVGKTSSKEAVSLILSCKKSVRSSFANYNNEFGLPLTIIGKKSGDKNIFSWLKIFYSAILLILFNKKNYPEVLILETGIDRVGDMDYLNSIFKADRAILTNISHSHIEYFGSLEKIKKEKVKLLKNLKKNGIAIINFDNENLKNVKNELKNPVLSYGINSKADINAKDLNFVFPENIDLHESFYGASFKLEYRGSIVPVNLYRAVSISSIYSFLSATTTALSMGFNLVDLINCAKNFKNPKGRMNLIKGIKNTIIIDDTYNSSPESSNFAINFLKNIKIKKNSKKFIVLGDMLELGHYSEEGHRLIGKNISKSDIKNIILVGEKSRDIRRGAVGNGFNKDNIFHFMNINEAGLFIQDKISEADVILVKASQGMRFEKIVKEIMAEPQKSKELLVRQSKEWLAR